MQKYAIPTLILALVSVSVYAFSSQESLEEKLEEENKQLLEDFAREQSTCYTTATWTSYEISQKHDACSHRQMPNLRTITWTWSNAKATTGSVIPEASQWYTSKHQLILSGSHDYRIYSDRKWASWKNNNPSWLTWWVSTTLKWLWKERWIEFEKWTLRPKREGGNYIRFWTIEQWLRAKVVSIRERWWKANVAHFLAWWWTDYVKLSFSTDKIISELTEEEFAELFIQQLKKESPWLISQLVKDWILIIN